MLYTIHTIPIHPFTVYTNLFRPYPLSTFLFTLNSPHSSSSFIQPFSVCILYLYSLFYPSLSFILFSVLSVLILYPLLCYIRPYSLSSSLLFPSVYQLSSSPFYPSLSCILFSVNPEQSSYSIQFHPTFFRLYPLLSSLFILNSHHTLARI